MGELIKTVFGKSGGRCDKQLPHDLNRAYDIYVEACKIDDDSTKYNIAEHMFREVIRIDPQFSHAFARLGNVLYHQGKVLDAKEFWIKASALDPNEHTNWFNLGTVAYMQNNFDKAIDFLNKTIKLNPQMADVYYNLALTYEKVDLIETARKHWLRVLTLEPDSHPDIRRRLNLTKISLL